MQGVRGPSNPLRTRLQSYARLLGAVLREAEPMFILREMPGNIGDDLIWAGTDELLAMEDLDAADVPVPQVNNVSAVDGTLVVLGSGAFDARWHEWLPQLVVDASRRFRKVIILPSSFDLSVPIVVAALSRPNVYVIARDPVSFRAIRKFGRAGLALDTALFCSSFRGPTALTAPSAGRRHRLVVLRQDQGSPLKDAGMAPNPSVNEDISLTAPDLRSWLELIQQADVVFTDRLHVAVAAIMFGKRLHYLDPYHDKISSYVNYAFRGEFDHLVSKTTIDEMKQLDLVVEAGAR